MIIAYKALDPDLSCTSGGHRFQYKIGVWNQEPAADCAKRGFHCAEDPLDCFTYYPHWDQAVYYMVLADGDIDEDGRGSKISCTRLKLVKQLNLEEFVAHSLHYLIRHPGRASNYRVRTERGEAQSGLVIVRGKGPAAKGKLGDILGLAREEEDRPEIAEAGVFIVDGKKYFPDIWYDVHGKPLGGMRNAEKTLVDSLSA